jgi:alanyl-tRNA synthetase
MEQKLYYQDPYQNRFSAEVIREEMDETGRLYAVLTQTAFYPTGGGQPFDTGTLNGIQVVDVEESNGEIRHYIVDSIGKGGTVEGIIDWERRFDHMQQHSGQHILSAAFEELFQYKTISFHLGRETLTIDLETDQLTQEEAAAAEALANKVILENRPIHTKWVDSEEIKQYTLRKELSVTEDIRLVIIPDFDYNGCGGTHPDSTGQVASLKILGFEKQKKKIRVEFVCGNRVLKQLGQKNTVSQQLISLLNAPEQELATAVRYLLDSKKDLEKTIDEFNERLLNIEAEALISSSGERVVGKLFLDRSMQELQKLARRLAEKSDHQIFVLLAENEDKLQFVLARGQAAEGDMKAIASKALLMIQGKGGGSAAVAQGGGGRLMPGEEFLQVIIDLAGTEH